MLINCSAIIHDSILKDNACLPTLIVVIFSGTGMWHTIPSHLYCALCCSVSAEEGWQTWLKQILLIVVMIQICDVNIPPSPCGCYIQLDGNDHLVLLPAFSDILYGCPSQSRNLKVMVPAKILDTALASIAQLVRA